MKIRTLLLALPTALLSMNLLVVGALSLEVNQSSDLLKAGLLSTELRDATAVVGEACEAMTQRTIIWTVTRRSSEKKIVANARKTCVDGVVSLAESMPDKRELITGLAEQARKLASLLETIQDEYSEDTKIATVGRLEREVKPLAKELADGLNELKVESQQRSASSMLEIEKKQSSTLVLALLAGAVSVILGSLITLIVIRRIMVAVTQAIGVAERLADGNLKDAALSHHDDEVGQILVSLDNARLAWIDAITEIQGSTAVVAQTSGDIATGASQLNSNTIHTSKNINETSSSVDKLADNMEKSSNAAKDAASLAGTATQLAERGGHAVGNVVSTMSDIEVASKKITEIIGLIENLAFRTNMLALNAAVEAAHAGEHGKGFSIVATEVRDLAQRSRLAAGEIRGLIDGAISRVNEGSTRAIDASKAINDVCEMIVKVDSAIRICSVAAYQQNSEIAALVENIRSIESTVQSNSEASQDWLGASERLRSESTQLERLVQRFELPT